MHGKQCFCGFAAEAADLEREGPAGGAEALKGVARTMVAMLQLSLGSRDTQVTCAVILWTLVGMPRLPPAAHAARVRALLFADADGDLDGRGEGRSAEGEGGGGGLRGAAPNGLPGPSGPGRAPRPPRPGGPFPESVGEAAFAGTGTSLRRELGALQDVGRLCCVRGLVSITPLAVLLSPVPAPGEAAAAHGSAAGGSPPALLPDLVVPRVCGFVEAAKDGHFNFHAFHALHQCLQQLAKARDGGAEGAEGAEGAMGAGGPPLEAATADRILKLVLANLEDPLAQTVRHVQAAFALLLRLQSAGRAGAEVEPFLQAVARKLLVLGAHRKGRYVPLAEVARRLGAGAVLALGRADGQDLLRETFAAMRESTICSAASEFLKVFLAGLRAEAEAAGRPRAAWLVAWMPDLVAALGSPDPARRQNLATYALPLALAADGECLLDLVATLVARLDGPGAAAATTADLASLICVLKAARKAGKLDRVDEVAGEGGERRRGIPLGLLRQAATAADEPLRLDCFELLCLHPKTTALPAPPELRLLRAALPYQFTPTDPGHRNR